MKNGNTVSTNVMHLAIKISHWYAHKALSNSHQEATLVKTLASNASPTLVGGNGYTVSRKQGFLTERA